MIGSAERDIERFPKDRGCHLKVERALSASVNSRFLLGETTPHRPLAWAAYLRDRRIGWKRAFMKQILRAGTKMTRRRSIRRAFEEQGRAGRRQNDFWLRLGFAFSREESF